MKDGDDKKLNIESKRFPGALTQVCLNICLLINGKVFIHSIICKSRGQLQVRLQTVDMGGKYQNMKTLMCLCLQTFTVTNQCRISEVRRVHQLQFKFEVFLPFQKMMKIGFYLYLIVKQEKTIRRDLTTNTTLRNKTKLREKKLNQMKGRPSIWTMNTKHHQVLKEYHHA